MIAYPLSAYHKTNPLHKSLKNYNTLGRLINNLEILAKLLLCANLHFKQTTAPVGTIYVLSNLTVSTMTTRPGQDSNPKLVLTASSTTCKQSREVADVAVNSPIWLDSILADTIRLLSGTQWIRICFVRIVFQNPYTLLTVRHRQVINELMLY